MKNNYKHWIILAEQYINTSKLIMQEMIKCKNKWIYIGDKPIKDEEYFETTKWSDFNTLVPSIFLLVHGLELLTKALVTYCGEEIKREHDTTNMIKFLKNDNRINCDLLNLLECYVGEAPSNPIIQEFINVNKHIKAGKVHIAIRYPEDNRNETDFSPLWYKEKKLIEELKVIVSDIENIYSKALLVIGND